MEWVAFAALTVLLLGFWIAATRRHRRSRAVRDAEWQRDDGSHDGEGRTELWTSGARCPNCEAVGGLVEPTPDGGAVFTCMSCGARHRREQRG